MEDTKEKKKIEFEITKMVLDTYTKIATWNNADFDTVKHKQDALKVVAHDITQHIIEEVFKGINGIETGVVVTRGDQVIGETKSNTESFTKKDEKEIFQKIFNK